MTWFEERQARKRSVVVLPTPETYYKRFDLYLTLEGYWDWFTTYCYADWGKPSEHFRGMTMSEYISFDWYEVLRFKSKWSDEDYARTRAYRQWKADYETANEQAEYAKWRNDIRPVITWPDRRRNMVRTFKKTGEK